MCEVTHGQYELFRRSSIALGFGNRPSFRKSNNESTVDVFVGHAFHVMPLASLPYRTSFRFNTNTHGNDISDHTSPAEHFDEHAEIIQCVGHGWRRNMWHAWKYLDCIRTLLCLFVFVLFGICTSIYLFVCWYVTVIDN